MQNKTCFRLTEDPDSLYSCSCKNFYDCDFPRIKLQLSNQTNLTLNSSQYIRYDYAKLRCVVLIEGDYQNLDKGNWRLGNLFLNAYLTIFDIEKERMGFV